MLSSCLRPYKAAPSPSRVQRDHIVQRVVGGGQELLDVARALADALFVIDECYSDKVIAELALVGNLLMVSPVSRAAMASSYCA